MSELFYEAGPFVLPVLLLGTTALAASVLHLRSGSPRSRALAIGTAIATVLIGAVGTITGLQRALSQLPLLAADERWIVQLGLYESLHTTVLGLSFAILVTVLLTVAAVRRPSQHDAGATAALNREPSP